MATKKTAVKQRFYPAEDTPVKIRNHKVHNAPKTRKSITPGTILILLSGRFAGKRVVYLKTLDSGLLLVTGPFKLNGVPLRRVNQAFVIATSAKIDVSSVTVPELKDAYFAKPKAAKTEMFDPAVKNELDSTRIEHQKLVDTQVMKAVKKVELMKNYLSSRFSLSKGQAPHLMKF